jgi:hypothetical protein
LRRRKLDILFKPTLEGSNFDGNRNNTAIYECTTCLSGVQHLHNLPSNNASYIGNMLLNHGAMNGRYYFTKLGVSDRKASIVTQIYYDTSSLSGDVKNTVSFLGDLPMTPPTKEAYDALLSKSAPQNEDGVRTRRYALNAAHQAARTPLLPLIGAERTLPIVNQIPGQEAETLVIIQLHVKWERVYLILGSILGGTLLTVLATVVACKGVPMQDPHSHFTVGCLLRGAIGMAEYAGWNRMKLRYAAKMKAEGVYEVGLWAVEGTEAEVVSGFPEGLYRPDLWTEPSETQGGGDRQGRKRDKMWRGGEDCLTSPDPMMGEYGRR